MNRTLIGFAVAITVAAAANSFAEDKAKGRKAEETVVAEKAKKASAGSYAQNEAGTLTGSYIKQPIRRAGLITDGASNVQVIDRTMIERSGAADLRRVLTRTGVH